MLSGALVIICLSAFGQITPSTQAEDTVITPVAYMRILPLTYMEVPESPNPVTIPLPGYTQGLFCDFEDAMNRNRRLRIDFGVK